MNTPDDNDFWAEAERRSHERGEHVEIPGLACHVCRAEASRALTEHLQRLNFGAVLEAHVCGALCPTHGDPRDTSMAVLGVTA